MRVADAALAQARAQGLATSALITDAAKARLQATAASAAVTQAVASTSLLGRAAGILRGALALLGGPIGLIVTSVTLLAGVLYSARNAVVEFGGKTASIRQIVVATWDLVLEKVADVVSALGRLVGALMNLRSRWSGIATGDQGIFVTRDLFGDAGGFPPAAPPRSAGTRCPANLAAGSA